MLLHCSTFYADAKGSCFLSVLTPRKQSLLCLGCIDISFHLLFSVLFVFLHQKNRNFSSKALSFELCNLTRHDSLCFLLVTSFAGSILLFNFQTFQWNLCLQNEILITLSKFFSSLRFS